MEDQERSVDGVYIGEDVIIVKPGSAQPCDHSWINRLSRPDAQKMIIKYSPSTFRMSAFSFGRILIQPRGMRGKGCEIKCSGHVSYHCFFTPHQPRACWAWPRSRP